MYFKACLKGTCERAASTMFFCVHFGRKWGKRDKKNIEEKNIDEKDIQEKNIKKKILKKKNIEEKNMKEKNIEEKISK